MPQTKNLITFLSLGGLAALGLVLALANGDAQRPVAMAMRRDRVGANSRNSVDTVHMPLAFHWHDPSYVSPFGVTMYGGVSDATGLQTMRDGGARWATTHFKWSAIEPTKGNYIWSSFDAKAQNAQAAGISLFVLFTSNPSWAATLPGGPVTDIHDLENICARMAERYDCDGNYDAPGSPCVHYWSFYAEPDNGSLTEALRGRGYWGHDGAGYAAMLNRISPVIHAANPRAKILIGGLAYDWFEEEGGPFVRSFLDDTLGALNQYPGGVKAYIDALAFHFYPIATHRWPTIREKALEVRGIMKRHGIDDLTLLCPEGGYWSSVKYGSSEQGQARRLAQMYVRSLSVYVQPLSWFKVFDTAWAGSADDDTRSDTVGLLRVDGSHKPAYYAYRTVASELGYAHYSRPFQSTNAEGYVFLVSGGREKTVLWAKTSAAKVTFPYSCLRLVDKVGAAQDIHDDDPTRDLDKTKNGRITLLIAQNEPVYVEPCP